MDGTVRVLRQAGALAYRVRDARIEVLLITSRDTGRWIIPKGNIEDGAKPSEAAEQEAYEDAGIRGTVNGSLPLGSYTYCKRLGRDSAHPAAVEVCLLKVRRHLKKWPEKGSGNDPGCRPKKPWAASRNPGVVPLLRRVMELETRLVVQAPEPR
jgi:predicted NUDIX family NTP pyrophosphohydrolase